MLRRRLVFSRLNLCAAARFVSSDVTEAAARITRPSAEHPATGEANPPAGSPAVQWREHWDLMERKPYYHNLITHQTTWAMPAGFPTRFGRYYSRLKEEHDRAGLNTDEHINAMHVAQTTAVPLPQRSLRDQLMDYGPSGFALYGLIHFVGFVGCFVLLFWGVDLAAIARSFGYDTAPVSNSSTGAIFLAAVAVNKLFVPVHIVMTLALAPRLTPAMKFGWKRFVYYNQ